MKINFNFVNKKGFTLIELLVVISIISLLSSVVLASLSNARAGARDAKRVSDIRQMQIAIELYILDNGYAPGLGTGCDSLTNTNSSCIADPVNNLSRWQYLESELSSYISSLPSDPCGASCPGASVENWYSYEYLSPAYLRSQQVYWDCDGNCSSSYSLNANQLEKTSNPYEINVGVESLGS